MNAIPAESSSSWITEGVDTQKFFSNFYSRAIALDDSSYPHIAYGGDHLYYVYQNGSGWSYETIDFSSNVGEFASLALDSSDKAHISYYDTDKSDLKYATNASGSWVIEAVDGVDAAGNDIGNVGQYTSLALDSSGNVHISYYDVGRADLKYATNASGSWISETVDGIGLIGVGTYTSIAMDSLNNVHISYYSNGILKYATKSVIPDSGNCQNNDWNCETVDNSADVGLYTSIAIDPLNNVHISYYDWTNEDLKYATGSLGSWSIQTIDSTGDVGIYTSLTIDTSGKTHISYHDVSRGELKYATNTSGSWGNETVDNSADVGLYTSIALDGSTNVHISYYDLTNGDLKYVTDSSGSWIDEAMDSNGNVGTDTSIATDSSETVHISYYDWDNGDLKYATGTAGYIRYCAYQLL
jgi:hypothetical protein